MTVNSAYGGTAIDAAYILQIDAKTINTAHILQIDGSHSAHGGPIRKINAAHILQIYDGISGMSFVCLNTRWCTYTADRCRYFRHIFCMLKYACMCMLVSTSKKCTCVHAYRIRTKRLSSSLMPDLARKHLQRNLLPQARWRLLRVRSERGLTSRQRPLHASTHALLSTSRVVTFLWTFRSQRCQIW